MADLDDVKDTKNYHLDVPAKAEPFFLKGSNALDWGMQNRLAKVFSPASGRTVMLAIDHGYFQGPTTGLERVDLNIVPIAPYADALVSVDRLRSRGADVTVRTLTGGFDHVNSWIQAMPRAVTWFRSLD